MITTTFSTAAPGRFPGAGPAAAPPDAATFAEMFGQVPDEPDTGIIPLERLPLTEGTFEEAGLQALERFENLLRQRMAEQGIAADPPLSFTSDASGKLHQTAPHPQAEQIDAILQADERLGRYFQQASDNLAVARAGREHARFSEVYEKNPDLAVMMFSHLFNDQAEPPTFSVALSAELAEPVFT